MYNSNVNLRRLGRQAFAQVILMVVNNYYGNQKCKKLQAHLAYSAAFHKIILKQIV